jgi:acetyl esterase/lipase
VKRIFLLAVVFTGVVMSQDSDSTLSLPRDNYFTIQTATIKVHRSYANAEPVVPKLPDGVALSNLVYATYGKRRLHVDVFEPPKERPGLHPAVLLIHGGGWCSGDRSMEIPMAQELAARGYVAATVKHRLSFEAKYPAAVRDLKAAVRWLRANASSFGIDTAKIGAYGCSSGGQLASLLGATNGTAFCNGEGDNLDRSSDVQAVVNVDGPLDMTDPEESGKDDDPSKPSAGRLRFGATYKEQPGLWKEASPVYRVQRTMPPIAFINSSLARYHVGRDEMIEKMKPLGKYSEVHTIPETPHTFWLFHPWFEPTVKFVAECFDKTLKGETGNHHSR